MMPEGDSNNIETQMEACIYVRESRNDDGNESAPLSTY